MRKILFILGLFFVLGFFSSCLSTLYPFFTENDVVFNQNLIGEWAYNTSKNKKGHIYFEPIPQSRLQELSPGIRKLAGKGYFVTHKNDTGTPESKDFVFLAKIGNNYYLDYYPALMDFEKPVNDDFKAHYVKMHRCYRINIRSRDEFDMSRLEASFLDDLIDKKKIHIRYEEINDLEKTRVITASTEELQQYLLKYGNEPKAYNADNSYACIRVITP